MVRNAVQLDFSGVIMLVSGVCFVFHETVKGLYLQVFIEIVVYGHVVDAFPACIVFPVAIDIPFAVYFAS